MTRILPAVFLMGPTASGKTGLSLALAEHAPVEIVSVDSAQVYRGMDIGTAKPSPPVRARVVHHLVDICDPAEAYSAARFADDARRLVEEIRGRGRVPLLVGGTMLYFRALQRGLSALPSADATVRARLASEAQARGWPALHARLAAVDPVTAARLHPNDRQRVQRALEIFELTGRPASALHGDTTPAIDGPLLRFALLPAPRSLLHERIDRRFDRMMADGFVDEVRRLRARSDLTRDLPSMRAVGYRQLWMHLDGELSLQAAVDEGKAATRQYAKRQLTWLRAEAGVTMLDPDAPDLVDRVLAALKL